MVLPLLPFGNWSFDGPDEDDEEYEPGPESVYPSGRARKMRMTPEEQKARIRELARQRAKIGNPAARAFGAGTAKYQCGKDCGCHRACKAYQTERLLQRQEEEDNAR